MEKETLSKTETYSTVSMLGMVFLLKYLGMEDGKHVFVSISWPNRGHRYRVDYRELDTFLLRVKTVEPTLL